jgi:outer membrane biosynthesis protein TonB
MVQPQMGCMTRWFVTLLLGGSLALSGCSMALTGPSPERPRGKAPQCDTSKGLVFVDALLASTLGIVAVSVGSNNGGEAVIPLIGAGVFVASAIHGNNVVNECNRDLANYDSEMASLRPLPPDPDGEPKRPVVAMQPRPVVAMQPPSQPQMQPPSQPQMQPPPQQQPPPQPPPPAQQQPEPPPQAQPSSREPWAAFWKETP